MSVKNYRWLIMGFIGIFLICYSDLGWAVTTVNWPHLGSYLKNNNVRLKTDLPLCNCPLVLDESSGRQVVQVIVNTLYSWREYQWQDAEGRAQLALVMERPQPSRLTADEARVLLTASDLWQDSIRKQGNAASTTITTPLETTNRLPSPRVRASRGSDGSELLQKVPSTTIHPFNSIAFLNYYQADGWYRGNAVLISPRCLLTSGNNICWTEPATPQWSSKMTIAPGLYTDGRSEDPLLPYGVQRSEDLRLHPQFLADKNELSEYDLGSIIVNEEFDDLGYNGTLMPMEFDVTPKTVRAAGYPFSINGVYPLNDMWLGSGSVLGIRDPNQQIIDIDIYCGGFNGSPIWYHNEVADQDRLIGIATWHSDTVDSGVRLTSRNREIILGWIEASMGIDYDYTSYAPYLVSGINSFWTGVALANHNAVENHFKLEYFTAAGIPNGIAYYTLGANAQLAGILETLNPEPGWVKVSSSDPHHGLTLVGKSIPSAMFDMDLKSELAENLIFPHLAADNQRWDSTVMACNPNPAPASITYVYYDQSGVATRATTTILANGSLVDNLYERFGKSLGGGHLIMQSSQPITAFLLYDSSSYGSECWTAGLSAESLH